MTVHDHVQSEESLNFFTSEIHCWSQVKTAIVIRIKKDVTRKPSRTDICHYIRNRRKMNCKSNDPITMVTQVCCVMTVILSETYS